ncbi:hypothetical protein ACFYTF_28960 [Nocardia thailandica]|uniref:Apea-like HEPN domain-containing protein n=1 Tax=Nocardia thailandica TaxID=257275 RepID=A0ABW6PWW5_9NOCA
MGTYLWKNWRAWQDGQPELENSDSELQSDVLFDGQPVSFGPYTLTPVTRDSQPTVGPAIVLHSGLHADLTPQLIVGDEFAKPDSNAWHGGADEDEIAALISLILGVRLRYAGTFRLSGIHDINYGRPPIHREVPRLARPGLPGREMLPRIVTRPTSMAGLTRLDTFPSLDESSQVAIVRAARSYAAAIWWANEDPNQSWLQLVTAVEIAAKARQRRTKDHMAVLQEFNRPVWSALEPASDQVRQNVAKALSRLIGATRSFVDFVCECAPPPPAVRPPHYEAVDWEDMRSHAQTIYSHRSRALHEGVPFPMPMLRWPAVDDAGVIQEAPDGHAVAGLGGIWKATEYPMNLSTFEHIARGSILRWWDELNQVSANPAPSPSTPTVVS